MPPQQTRSKTDFLPEFRRARGHYLYDGDGRRWLDLWLDGGRALLGHRLPRLGQKIKATLDRGLLAPYSDRETVRLLKLLAQLQPDFPHVCIASTPHPLVEAFDGRKGIARWRPGWTDYRSFDLLSPVLPLPGLEAPLIILARTADLLPCGGRTLILSPLLGSALQRATARVLHHPPQWPTDLSGFDRQSCWSRSGPYLRFYGSEQQYAHIRRAMAGERVLLPPSNEQLTIIPPQLSPSDFKQLERAALHTTAPLYQGRKDRPNCCR